MYIVTVSVRKHFNLCNYFNQITKYKGETILSLPPRPCDIDEYSVFEPAEQEMRRPLSNTGHDELLPLPDSRPGVVHPDTLPENSG